MLVYKGDHQTGPPLSQIDSKAEESGNTSLRNSEDWKMGGTVQVSQILEAGELGCGDSSFST